jgi:hypothetical protein
VKAAATKERACNVTAVKILKGFPFSTDGINQIIANAGDHRTDIPDDLIPGLEAERYLERAKGEPIKPPAAVVGISANTTPLTPEEDAAFKEAAAANSKAIDDAMNTAPRQGGRGRGRGKAKE